MADPMQEIRASFFVECEELLEALFDALQNMSEEPGNIATINVAFRAVHSIKGGAGAFALDDLVAFAHQFETVMDMVRSSSLAADDALLAIFFRCGDMLSDLVHMSRDSKEIDESLYHPLLQELSSHAGVGLEEAAEEVAGESFQPVALDLDLEPSVAASDPNNDEDFDLTLADILGDESTFQETAEVTISGLTIVFSPTSQLYSLGNEPLFVLRNVADLSLCDTKLDFEPSGSFETAVRDGGLTWTLKLSDARDLNAAQEAFEFVDGLCTLSIQEDSDSDNTTALNLPLPKASEIAAPALDQTSGVESADRVAETEPKPPVPTPQPAQKQTTQTATVRVDLNRIDRLVNLVGELVINQAMLSQSFNEANVPANSKIASGLDEFMQLTRDIQESVMMIRAQPVKSLFQRMSRIVREASAAVDKKVRLVTEGDTTEIDKTVIERLADPLTHMIRNSVDHGLETPETRTINGKSAEGVVRLSASHRSGRVVIEIADDGAGINREKVLSIATSKGLVPEDANLSDSEIENLLFLPGFSTATEVSNLSGRGVGMDVVKNAITALGGRISIQSTPGQGTVISISLPLTLAVLDGMVISVESETLVVPLNAISETLTLQPGSLERLGPGTSVISVRDEFVPLIDLGVELGYRQPKTNYDGAIALLIVQEDGSRSAMVVDGIEDQRQVVIKGLQDSYGNVPGVAAATILGDGQIALILDTSDLLSNASGRSREVITLEKAS